MRLIPILLSALLTLIACSRDSAKEAAWVDHGEVTCAAPVDSFDRFEDQAELRGITPDDLDATMSPYGIPAGLTLAAVDGDGDGDVDLFFPTMRGHPQVFENDGNGFFTPGPVSSPGSLLPEDTMPFGLIDMNGDNLPDLTTFGLEGILYAPNLGGLRFGVNQIVYSPGDEVPVALIVSGNWGDVDGDGDLDLYIPRMDELSTFPPPSYPVPSRDLLLINTGNSYELGGSFGLEGDEAGLSMSATFTDRDNDGDQDVLVLSDGAQYGLPASSFFNNETTDNEWSLTDDGAETGANIAVSGMGVDVLDINSDGLMDYCFTDIAQPDCLISRGDGGYYLGGRAMGLMAPPLDPGMGWSGWSIDVLDYDNDGNVDAAASAGFGFEARIDDSLNYDYQPDAIWQGKSDGTFELVSEKYGWGFGEHHYGMISADLDGDGFLEILFSGPEGPVVALWNQCGEGAWLEVQLEGTQLNSSAYGARVEISYNDRQQTREMANLRTFSQGPDWIHFGLGDVDSVDVRVNWPDGLVTISEDVPTRRRITIVRP